MIEAHAISVASYGPGSGEIEEDRIIETARHLRRVGLLVWYGTLSDERQTWVRRWVMDLTASELVDLSTYFNPALMA